MIPIILCYWISLYTYMFILSAYSRSMGASLSMVGMITGVFGLMQLFLRMPFGLLSDHVENRKRFFFVGLGCFALAGLGLYLAPTPAFLLVFNAVAGVGASTWAIFSSSYCSYFPPEQTVRVIGSLNVMMSAGQLAGTFGGGILAQLLGRRQVFLASMIPALIGLLLLFWIDDTYRHGGQKVTVRDFTRMVTGDATLLFYSILAAILNFMSYAATNSFVPIILTGLGASSMQTSTGSTLCVLAMALSASVSCTVLKDKLGIRWASILGFALIGAPLFLYAQVGSIPVILALQFVFGLGRGIILPLSNACATAHLDARIRSTGMATFQAIYAVGMFAGPATAGAFSDLFSLQTAFAALGGICVAVSAYLLVTRRIRE